MVSKNPHNLKKRVREEPSGGGAAVRADAPPLRKGPHSGPGASTENVDADALGQLWQASGESGPPAGAEGTPDAVDLDQPIELEASHVVPPFEPGARNGGVDVSPAWTTAGSRRRLRCKLRSSSEPEIAQLWGHIFFGVEHLPPQSIIVTGARRGDGATQIAASLALVGAGANRELRIALVDFNLRDPRIADVLGIAPSPGLTDVLEGRVELENAFQTVVLQNGGELHVLPGCSSGSGAAHPLSLLKSRRLREVVQRIQQHFDHAIFDVTATNAHPDPQVIGPMVDGAVLVVRSGDTPRETVAQAKRRLEIAGARCLGLVLNQRSDPIPSFVYHNI